MDNQKIKRYVLRAAIFLFGCFACLALYVTWLQTLAADSLAKNPLNQRVPLPAQSQVCRHEAVQKATRCTSG